MQQPAYLPAQQTANLPVQQPAYLPAQQTANLPVQQPTYLPAQQTANLPVQQPVNLRLHQPSIPPITVTAPQIRPAPTMQQPTVYHYRNPTTGEHVASLLPPGHPDMLCLQQGGHVPTSEFGIAGKDKQML